MGFFSRKKKVAEEINEVLDTVIDVPVEEPWYDTINEPELRTCIIPVQHFTNRDLGNIYDELLHRDIKVCQCNIKFRLDDDGDLIDHDCFSECVYFEEHQINIYRGDLKTVFQELRLLDSEYITVELVYYGTDIVDHVNFWSTEEWAPVMYKALNQYGKCYLYKAHPITIPLEMGVILFDEHLNEVSYNWSYINQLAISYITSNHPLEGKEKYLIIEVNPYE